MIILIVILLMVVEGRWTDKLINKDSRGTLLFSGILEMIFEFILLCRATC